MRGNFLEYVLLALFFLLLYLAAEAHYGLTLALFYNLVKCVERAAADEENVLRVYLDEFLVRMLSAALGRYVCYRSFEYLEKRLLNTLAGNVPCNRAVFAASGYLVYLVNVYDSALCKLYVVVGSLNEPEKNVLNVFANISGFGKRCSVGYSERDFQGLCESLREECLAYTRRTDEQNVALLYLDTVVSDSFCGVLLVFRGVFQLLLCVLLDEPLVVIVNRYGKRDFCSVLSDDVLVESRFYLHRLRERLLCEGCVRAAFVFG